MNKPALTLLKILWDEERPAWERDIAGRTLLARVRQKLLEVDASELSRVRRTVARDAEAFARRPMGDA